MLKSFPNKAFCLSRRRRPKTLYFCRLPNSPRNCLRRRLINYNTLNAATLYERLRPGGCFGLQAEGDNHTSAIQHPIRKARHQQPRQLDDDSREALPDGQDGILRLCLNQFKNTPNTADTILKNFKNNNVERRTGRKEKTATTCIYALAPKSASPS
ncbi:hypothetical protein HRbin01_00708 [archaeon HR01]|nr:hypothetical protein HRbin01_00708 [archaeon HR01]